MSERLPQIGQYVVERELGRGGMGVVYLATDPRLGRQVAIKALPDHFAGDPERLARFEREARTLASLNHPNIAGIYGVEEHEGRRFLVLEFAEGETLADRLDRGPLPVEDALEICDQIAAGLEAAHDAGVIHRDLKPANICITPDGQAKVLDFGLARSDEAMSSGSSVSQMPTLTTPHSPTTPGAILGTAPYMSPEQARGRKVDKRSDIWSFGVVLFECLTGRNPFDADATADVLANVLHLEPDLSALPPTTPTEIHSLIGRCLRKDARRRQRDAGDARLILEDAQTTERASTPASSRLTSITEGRFTICDQLCRTLDRDGFDAMLPGWEMLYADNNRDSDILIIWIPSIGGDHTTGAWRELIAESPYRMVIACPVGMEPNCVSRPVVSMENQLSLLRAFGAHLRARISPRKMIVAGFACGSTLALRCAAGDTSGEVFDGVLTIDADLQESNCFLARLFASLDPTSTSDVMHLLNTMSGSCHSMLEWLTLHHHMIECVDKVKNDFTPLIRQGRDLSSPFEGVHDGKQSPFVQFLRNAIERTPTVRCVFGDGAENRRVIGEIRMMHLDNRCLGPRFTDETLRFIPVSEHIELLSNERLLEQLDLIVQAVCA